MADNNVQLMLSRFEKSVNTDVNAQIFKMTRDATEEKERFLKTVEERTLYDCYQTIQKAVRKTESNYRRLGALRQHQINTDLLKHRDSLVTRIFDAIKNRIEEFVNSDEYDDFLLKQLKNENTNDAVIRVSEADSKREVLKKTGCEVVVDNDIVLGGIALFYEDRGIIIDKTFDTALQQQKQDFYINYRFITTGGTVDGE